MLGSGCKLPFGPYAALPVLLASLRSIQARRQGGAIPAAAERLDQEDALVIRRPRI